MFFAAAEERGDNLLDGRGDAYCGMLNASYNLKLRGMKAYIPEYPVGNAEECAEMLHEFVPIVRAVVGLSSLKIISFGPRPLNFLACNAPIQQLYNLGVEIEKTSLIMELQHLAISEKHYMKYLNMLEFQQKRLDTISQLESDIQQKILGDKIGGLYVVYWCRSWNIYGEITVNG